MLSRLVRVTLYPLLLVSACGSSEQSSIYTGDSGPLTLGHDTTSGPGPGDGDAEASTGDGDPTGESGPKLDVFNNDEMSSASDGGGSQGCKKVDFLFVIDNSGSMKPYQDNLVASFPGFINSIMNTLDDAQDYHIMVIDTDEWVYAGCPLLCPFFPNFCVGYECGVTQPEECEDILGAGVTYPKGADASNVDCNFATGKRFMDSDQPNLVGTFHCAARVGTGATTDPERPMEAMADAVSGLGPVGLCNEGFLRDDAILVVTFITDEDDAADDGSAGTVESWRQALISAKNGDESAIVVLGLFGDGDLPNSICGSQAEVAPRLRQFLESWGSNGFFGSICAPSYNEFFQDAVSIIDNTCDGFVPPK
jgi:hypothetical protein